MGTHPNARFRRVRCRPSSLPRRDTNTTLLDASMAHLEPRRRLWEFRFASSVVGLGTVETSSISKLAPGRTSQCEARSSDGTMSEAGDAFGEVEDGFASDLAGSDDNLESVHDEEEEEDGEDLMDNVLECVPSHPTKNLISAPPIARCEKPKPKPDPIPKPRIHPRTPHPSLTTTPPTHPR